MKKLILTALLMTSATLFAQSFDVYNVDSYGLEEVFPSKTYEPSYQDNVVLEYHYNEYGQRDYFPTRELHFKEDRLEIYNVDGGLPEFLPIEIIKFPK